MWWPSWKTCRRKACTAEVGTVVEEWKDGVFEVEFSDDSGKAYAFAALRPDQLMKLHFREGGAA